MPFCVPRIIHKSLTPSWSETRAGWSQPMVAGQVVPAVVSAGHRSWGLDRCHGASLHPASPKRKCGPSRVGTVAAAHPALVLL